MADYPTPAEVFAQAGAAGGRIAITRNELIRIMREYLPLNIEYANTRENLRIPPPEHFIAARETLEGLKGPIIAVGTSIGYINYVGGVRFPVTTAMVYAIAQAGDTRVTLDNLADLADLIRLTMQPIDGAWCLPDGRHLWASCLPQETSQLPADFSRNYMGYGVEFEIKQAGIDLWTPAA